jgi:hypothetical protein
MPFVHACVLPSAVTAREGGGGRCTASLSSADLAQLLRISPDAATYERLLIPCIEGNHVTGRDFVEHLGSDAGLFEFLQRDLAIVGVSLAIAASLRAFLTLTPVDNSAPPLHGNGTSCSCCRDRSNYRASKLCAARSSLCTCVRACAHVRAYVRVVPAWTCDKCNVRTYSSTCVWVRVRAVRALPMYCCHLVNFDIDTVGCDALFLCARRTRTARAVWTWRGGYRPGVGEGAQSCCRSEDAVIPGPIRGPSAPGRGYWYVRRRAPGCGMHVWLPLSRTIM